MSWAVVARSSRTAVTTAGVGALSADGTDSSVSIDAGSEVVSVKPSPRASASSSTALMRSTSASSARGDPGVGAGPAGHEQQAIEGLVEGEPRVVEVAGLHRLAAGLEVALGRRQRLGDRIGRRRLR